MKWTKDELELCVNLLKSGKTYEEISKYTKRTKRSVKNKLTRNGFIYDDYRIHQKEIIKCLNCGDDFVGYIIDNRKFCSHVCSAIFNNKKRSKFLKIIGNKKIENVEKYCNSKCQQEHIKNETYEKIENGNITLPHRQYKKYLIEKYGEKCME